MAGLCEVRGVGIYIGVHVGSSLPPIIHSFDCCRSMFLLAVALPVHSPRSSNCLSISRTVVSPPQSLFPANLKSFSQWLALPSYTHAPLVLTLSLSLYSPLSPLTPYFPIFPPMSTPPPIPFQVLSHSCILPSIQGGGALPESTPHSRRAGDARTGQRLSVTLAGGGLA